MSDKADLTREAEALKESIERKCGPHCLPDQVAELKQGFWWHPYDGEWCSASEERTHLLELRRQMAGEHASERS